MEEIRNQHNEPALSQHRLKNRLKSCSSLLIRHWSIGAAVLPHAIRVGWKIPIHIYQSW